MSAITNYIYITEELGLWSILRGNVVGSHVRIGVVNAVDSDKLPHDPNSYYPNVNMRVYACRDPQWVLSQITLSYGNVIMYGSIHGPCMYPGVTSNLYAMDVPTAIQTVLKVLALDAIREPMGLP